MDAAVVEHHVRDLLGAGADERERRRDLLAQRLERAQQHRQALAFDRLADEQDPQRSAGLGLGLGAGRAGLGLRLTELDPVGHDPVAPAVEAPRGPGGGLGDGDAHVQVVHPPPRAERVRDPVRERVLGVGVEGADERQLGRGRAERVPAEQRHDRLVDVHDVIAAARAARGASRARPAGSGRGSRRRRWRGSRPCARARQTPRAGPGAGGGRRGAGGARARRRGQRREDAGVVAERGQLGRERLDVACDPAGVRPRIRRKQRDSHGYHCTPRRGQPPVPYAWRNLRARAGGRTTGYARCVGGDSGHAAARATAGNRGRAAGLAIIGR